MKTIGPTIALAFLMALTACSDDKPKSEKSSGDESAFDRAERNANEAQQKFEKGFKETGAVIEDKANEAAAEGRKGARKVGDAITDEDNPEDEAPKPGQP
jgi:hypothetical protein